MVRSRRISSVRGPRTRPRTSIRTSPPREAQGHEREVHPIHVHGALPGRQWKQRVSGWSLAARGREGNGRDEVHAYFQGAELGRAAARAAGGVDGRREGRQRRARAVQGTGQKNYAPDFLDVSVALHDRGTSPRARFCRHFAALRALAKNHDSPRRESLQSGVGRRRREHTRSITL